MIENEIIRGILAGFAALFVDIASYHSFVGYQFIDSHSYLKNKVKIVYLIKLFVYPVIFPFLFVIFNIGNIYLSILSSIFVLAFVMSNYIMVINHQIHK